MHILASSVSASAGDICVGSTGTFRKRRIIFCREQALEAAGLSE